MSEQGEQPDKKINVEWTRERIANYRDAAGGWVDVHTYSYDGNVQRECFTEHGKSVDETIHEGMLVGFDGTGNKVDLVYDGVMPVVACTELADSLEAQLATDQ